MARPNNFGWDFVKKNKLYQYKEGPLIQIIQILENNSNKEYYRFSILPIATNMTEFFKKSYITHRRDVNIVYSDMPQIYEKQEYIVNYYILDQEKYYDYCNRKIGFFTLIKKKIKSIFKKKIKK